MVLVLKEFVKKLPKSRLIYLGKKDGSKFIWIGRAKDLPEEYMNDVIAQTYQHTSGYKGLCILTEGTNLKEGQKLPTNTYTYWWECDPSVKPLDDFYDCTDEHVEALLNAIARQAAADYRSRIKKQFNKLHSSPTKEEINHQIRQARLRCKDVVDFFEGLSMGDYILTRVEDEEKAIFLNPKFSDLEYKDRFKAIEDERKESIKNRVKQLDETRYAKIKGRSIYHG